MDVVERLKSFIENETRSCSMDFGAISPEYVFRMWGGNDIGFVSAKQI